MDFREISGDSARNTQNSLFLFIFDCIAKEKGYCSTNNQGWFTSILYFICISLCNTVNTGFGGGPVEQRRDTMSTSQMTSLRVPEENLLLLDQRVGFDGMRNRSDVIRASIQHYLDSTPSNADVRTVKFEIGRVTRERLEMIYRMHGDDASTVAKMALEAYIVQLAKPDRITEALQERLETSRDNTQPHEDHTA